MPLTLSCRHILVGHFDQRTLQESIEFNGIVLMRFISGALLLVLIVRNKRRASREDGQRATLLVLPSYYPAICGMILYYFVFSMLHIFVHGYGRYAVLLSLDVAINHAISEGLAFFLLQHGAGVYAFQRSALCALGIGAVAFFVYYFMFSESGDDDDPSRLTQQTYLAHVIFSSVLLSVYTAIWLLPSRFLYRRPAFHSYARFCIVENLFWVVASSLIYIDHVSGACTVLSGQIIFIGVLHPIVFVRSLAKDSEFWQGCNIPVADRSPVHEAWDLNLAAASTIGMALSDTQRQAKSLPMIHFSNIDFSMKSFIAGGLSRVYFGKYNRQEVAIKILFAIELTPKVVIDFYHEVQVMYQLQHENIVACLGVSVMPPTICVILEYCPHGSLFNFLHESNADNSATGTDPTAWPAQLTQDNVEMSVSSNNCPSITSQDISTNLSSVHNPLYATETATTNGCSGVKESMAKPRNHDAGKYPTEPLVVASALLHYLHQSYIPDDRRRGLLRISCSGRGRSSANLSSASLPLHAKFKDSGTTNFFAFGSSRQTMASTASSVSDTLRESKMKGTRRKLTLIEKYNLMLGACRGVAFLHSKGYMHCDIKSPNFLIAKDYVVKLADLGEARVIGQEYQSLPFPAYNWAPPELLNPDVSKRSYGAASDIYGLAMVFAEILTQELPMDSIFSTATEAEIFHHIVVDNLRPLLPQNIPDTLIDLITRAWDSEASLRPAADEALQILESIFSDALAEL